MEEQSRRYMGHQRKIIGVIVFLLISCSVYSQRQIKGIVLDSASFAPMSNVNIKVKNSVFGTATNSKGEFKLAVGRKDTLVFTLVGYYAEEFAAEELEATCIIRMTEQIRILQTVTVRPKAEQKTVRPLHLAPKGKLMNYGPSGAGINLGYFSKSEREKRKLQVVMMEHERVKNYVAVVCSPEVRERITEKYSISDDEYYEILAHFNMETGDALYHLSTEELIVVLNQYYKDNVRKR